MVTYHYIRSDTTIPQEQKFLAEYYALRSRAFNAQWGGTLYPDGPDEYDQRPNTICIVRIEDGKVVSGMRLLMHPAHSDQRVSMEVKYPEFAAKELLPNHDTESLTYAELGGLVSDPDEEYRTRHIATATFGETCKAVRDGKITCDGKPLDVMIASVSKTSLGAVQRAVAEVGLPGIVHMDKVRMEKDPQFDTKLWPMAIAARSDFELPKISDHIVPLSADLGRDRPR